jgi:hypothetical protein
MRGKTQRFAKGDLMASSDSGMTARNSALLKKFQGNGWAVSCSPESQKELSAILEERISAPEDDTNPSEQLPVYKSDWADTVFTRSEGWRAEDGFAPRWLSKATEGAQCAVFQLPTPDHRWVVKFDGKILIPFDYRKAGWKELHEIMVHGFLLDRTELFVGPPQENRFGPTLTTLADLLKVRGDLLRNADMIRRFKQRSDAGDQSSEEVYCSSTGTQLHGLDTQTTQGKEIPDRWRSCSEDFNKGLHDRLDRVFKTIAMQDRLAAAVLKEAVKFREGHWTFSDSVRWMTSLAEIPYDAKMTLKGKEWEIDIPDSSSPLMVPDSAGMRAIAKILTYNNIACPSALISENQLVSEFLSRPRHHKYFEAIYRRPRIVCGDPNNSEVERALCTAMRLKPQKYYEADHIISERSELHTVCKLPTGKVTLSQADALVGVRDLIKKQQVRLFFCSEPSQQFRRILADIEAGIVFARKQENLLQQVQPKSEEHRARIQKAVSRVHSDLREKEEKEDWTTRYDLLASHFYRHIRCGVVCQYTGQYRWGIEGVGETLDVLDLAADHIHFKRSKVNKAIRKARAKERAAHSLKQLSKGAAC